VESEPESEARSTASASSATPGVRVRSHASPEERELRGLIFLLLPSPSAPGGIPAALIFLVSVAASRLEEVFEIEPHLPVPHDAVRERHLRLPRRDHGLEVVPAVHERGLLARHQHERLHLREVGELLRVRLSGDDGVRRPTRARDQLAHARDRR
jgi:hypothetical protein